MRKITVLSTLLLLLLGCTGGKFYLKTTDQKAKKDTAICVLKPFYATDKKTIPAEILKNSDHLLWTTLKKGSQSKKIYHASQLRKGSSLEKAVRSAAKNLSDNHYYDKIELSRSGKESGFRYLIMPSIQYIDSKMRKTQTLGNTRWHQIAGSFQLIDTRNAKTISKIFFSNKGTDINFDDLLKQAAEKFLSQLDI